MKSYWAVLAVWVATAPTWAAISIYQRAPLAAAAGGSSSFYPAGYERHLAESFTLNQTADLSAVRFWGGVGGAFPVDPGAFTVSLWKSDGVSDNGIAGAPGTLIFQQETFVTSARFASQPAPGGSTRYDIDLGTTVRLNAGERYWFSVAGRVESSLSFEWSWHDSADVSGDWAGYNIFSANSWFVIESTNIFGAGRAFELFAIPSPGTLGVLAFVGLCARRRGR